MTLTCFSFHTSTDLSMDSLLQTAVVGAVQFDLFLSHGIPNYLFVVSKCAAQSTKATRTFHFVLQPSFSQGQELNYFHP